MDYNEFCDAVRQVSESVDLKDFELSVQGVKDGQLVEVPYNLMFHVPRKRIALQISIEN